MGALAGTGFGIQLILFKMASGGGLLWTMTVRARGREPGDDSGDSGQAAQTALEGLLAAWRAGRNAGYDGKSVLPQATQLGRLDVAAVVCSLYPAGTILLAALVLRELPTRRQLAGMALALGAVMLLSA